MSKEKTKVNRREFDRKLNADSDHGYITVMNRPMFYGWMICIIWWSVSIAEFGVANYTGTLETYIYPIAAQFIASLMLIFLFAAVSVLKDI